MCLNSYVVSIKDVRDHLGTSLSGEYILDYINSLNAETAVVEFNYIDRDYLIDYSGYYARAFEDIGRFTERIHFFSIYFTQADFEKALLNACPERTSINDGYLGFVVMKPFKKNEQPNPLVGRTLLKAPFFGKENPENYEYIADEYSANLYGLALKVESLPFQTKDHAVAACATMSLWISNSKMNSLFHTPMLSPLEITNRATSIADSSYRCMPNDGLSREQMLAFLKSIGLDYNILNIAEIGALANNDSDYKEINKDIVVDAVRAFVSAKIPIIANLILIRNSRPEGHAVVISGYEQDSNGTITKLYVHDDVFGPYCEVNNASEDPGLKFFEWSCEWTKEHNGNLMLNKCESVNLDTILIPLYPKIRLNFNIIYGYMYSSLVKESPQYKYILRLVNVVRYKEALVNLDFDNKIALLKKPMPRFLWVISTLKDKNIVRDDLFDATAHYLRRIDEVHFN